MRLVVYNIEYCRGINRSWKYLNLTNYVKIAKKTMVKISKYLKHIDPDILGLIELDSGSIRSNRYSASEFFADNLGMKYWVEKTKYARKSFYKVLNYIPIVRKHGNAILSKQKLYDTQFYFLSRGVKRLVIHSKIKVKSRKKDIDVHLFAVHLSIRRRTRHTQLKELAQLVTAAPNPKIVFGDFNTFTGLSELDTFVKEAGLRIAEKNGSGKTYPSWKPRYSLDHIYVSPDIIVRQYRILEDAILSDHLPVLMDFEVKN